jgi:hypothetical protein
MEVEECRCPRSRSARLRESAFPTLTLRAVTTFLFVVAGIFSVSPVAADAATARAAIAGVNAQREATGIPGGLVENPEWSQKCAQHLNYVNHEGLGDHSEDPNSPYYTAGGDEAAHNSLLGAIYEDGDSFFEFKPLHLMHVLDPTISAAGYADICLWLGGEPRFTETPTLYSYPSENMDIYPEMVVIGEFPFAPGDFVGLPQGTPTGPHLYILAHGPSYSMRGRITQASVVGPSGPVEIRTVDNATQNEQGVSLGDFLPAGGIIIPVHPLQEKADYTASATFVTEDGQTLTLTWGFHTTNLDLLTPEVSIFFSRKSLTVQSDSPTPGVLRITRKPSNKVVLGRALNHMDWGPRTIKHHLPGGRYQACFTQDRSLNYFAARQCVNTRFRTKPPLVYGTPRYRASTVEVPVIAGDATGRPATLWVQSLRRSGGRFVKAGRMSRRSIKLRARQTLRLHRGPQRIGLTVRRFSRGEHLYATGSVTLLLKR